MSFGDIVQSIINFNWNAAALVGLLVIIYYLIYIVWILNSDCDLRLAFITKFGKPVESLSGNVVWITGASSGIGENLAYVLAKVNCKLILSARREAELQKVKSKCLADNKSLKDDDIMVLPLDVCDANKHGQAFENILKHFGKLDILVNNAGRSQRGTWEKINLQVDKDMFDLNVFSYLSLSRIVLPHFLQRNSGQIVVMSSIAGIFGIPYSASYTGAKHSLHGYFRCLQIEKMDSNISVNIVCPGPIQTNFLSEAFTENPNEKFGQQTAVSKNKVSVERCAYLMALGMANKLPEIWISHSILLGLMYINTYYPNLGHLIIKTLGKDFLQRLRDTKETVQDNLKKE